MKPMILAHNRWKYSQKKINLNSFNVISACMDKYCLDAWYLYKSKAFNHSSVESGGKVPCMTDHSVIESPLSVNLVTTPIKI